MNYFKQIYSNNILTKVTGLINWYVIHALEIENEIILEALKALEIENEMILKFLRLI